MKQGKRMKVSNLLLKNTRGSVAIMMVMSALTLVTPIMLFFTMDITLNKLKVYNIEDRSKAKLTAESGLKFAMARLKLYKEAYNFLQNNKNAQDIVKPETLDMLWNFPFVYPLPVTEKMNNTQKEALADFNENTTLDGQMQVTINNISNKINLNLLRISLMKLASDSSSESENNNDSEQDNQYDVETQLFKNIQQQIESKSLEDDYFNSQYYGMEITPLVNEMKYFISDTNSMEDTTGSEMAFVDKDITPKHAPFTSMSEVYGLPSWPDDITELIKNEFTVHGAIMIDLNKITDNLLRLIIPDITPEDITAFFEYKNDPEDPKHFNNVDDFKNYIVSIGNIMTEQDFQKQIDNFKKNGIEFGPSPTLFKIVINAQVQRASYNLTAYVTLPAQPKPRAKTKTQENENQTNTTNTQTANTEENQNSNTEENETSSSDKDKKEQKTLLLDPRIVEIVIQ